MKTRRCPQCGASTLFAKRATQYLDPQTGEQRRTGNGCALALTLFIVGCIVAVFGYASLASLTKECSDGAKAAYANPASSSTTIAAYQDGCGWEVIINGCIGTIVVIGLIVASLVIAGSVQGKRTVLSKTSTVIHTFTCRKCLSEWTVIQEPEENTESESS